MSVIAVGAQTFNLAAPVAGVLFAACVVAVARLLLGQWRATPEARSRGWRVALLVAAQPLCATLLYLALFPPATPGGATTLVVATAGADAGALRAGEGGSDTVALPEVPTLAGVTREPDLATALRRRPGTQRVRIVGAGLEARDREAAAGLPVTFDPIPLPRGLVQLDAPSHAALGREFRVSGRVNGVDDGMVELLDPGRQRVDRVALGEGGRFSLTASARVAGAALFTARVRDARQRLVDEISVPVQVDSEPPPRVLLLAGASGPEVKFLRRWARDAGLAMHTQIAAGGGLQLGDAPMALNAGTLSRFDVAVIDERAWSSLGDGQRSALVEAVRGGLGLLLRVTATLSDAERRRLQALGFSVDRGVDDAAVRLAQARLDDDALRARLGPGSRDAPLKRDAPLADAPALTRRAMRLDAADGVPLLRDAAGTTLASWRAEGRGRVAVWTLTDTHRLVLGGRSDLHAGLWSDALATLARPLPRGSIVVDGVARSGRRVTLCGLDPETRVVAPGGGSTPVRLDPAAGPRKCGAFWPRRGGWHRVESGQRYTLVHVRADAEGPGLLAQEIRDATLRIAVESAAETSPKASARLPAQTAPIREQPGARWSWWLAWLLSSATLWWFERSGAGRRAAAVG